MPAITSANLANAIVKLVAADALPALMGNLVMGNLVNRDYEPVLAQAGDTINVPIPPAVVALAERIESDLLMLYPQFTANTATGTAGTTLTEAVVDAAETALFNAK